MGRGGGERGWVGVGRGGGGGGEREKKKKKCKTERTKGALNFSSHLNPLSLCQSSPNPLDACCEGFGKVRTTDLL